MLHNAAGRVAAPRPDAGSRTCYAQALIWPPTRTCTQRDYTHIRDHAHYRYLLHLDGASASYRLGLLLSTDSLVLRQRSPYVEYFTR